MTQQIVGLDYAEHSTYCGGIFSFRELVTEPHSSRLQVSIENTGEHGTLTLLLESSHIVVFDAEQADRWVKDYAWFRAQRLTNLDHYENNDTVLNLRPVEASGLPRDLAPGQVWQGWFVSSKPLPEGTVAFVARIGLFRQSVPRRYWSFITFDPVRPFISLRGEVLLQRLAPHRWLVAKLKFILRVSHLEALFGSIIGTFVCMTAADLLFGFPLLGFPGGIAIGYFAHHVAHGRTQLPRVRRQT